MPPANNAASLQGLTINKGRNIRGFANAVDDVRGCAGLISCCSA